MKKDNAREFAMQFVKPLTNEDFQGVYDNGASPIQDKIGKDFALETAIYGSSEAEKDMTNLWKVTRQVVNALSLLNDDHFALGFSAFTKEISKKFGDNPLELSKALNTVASQSWQIEKQSVRNFLDNIGYEYPNKNKPLQNNKYKY